MAIHAHVGDVRTFIAWVLILLVGTYFFVPKVQAFWTEQYENIAYAINPSTTRAFDYGESHFNASDSANYDLNRAKFFFNLVASKDPTYPYLYHELARIDFLKGNFTSALAKIDFQISMHGDSEPNSYYVRGLIEGYMGDYSDAANDYAYFLKFDPNDWAAMNDDAWVLLKAQRFQDAADITAKGLNIYPANPWLLNSNATALYELGQYQSALTAAQKAEAAVASLTDAEWSHAYPGNDPAITGEGLTTLKQAVADNVHTIQVALASSTVQ